MDMGIYLDQSQCCLYSMTVLHYLLIFSYLQHLTPFFFWLFKMSQFIRNGLYVFILFLMYKHFAQSMEMIMMASHIAIIIYNVQLCM